MIFNKSFKHALIRNSEQDKYHKDTNTNIVSDQDKTLECLKYNPLKIERANHNISKNTITGLLTDTIRQRKQQDDDITKMHNRIKLLQLEEEKVLRKIEETRRKAKILFDVQQLSEQRSKELQSKR